MAQNVAHEMQAARHEHMQPPRCPGLRSQPYACQSVLQRCMHAVSLPRMHCPSPCTADASVCDAVCCGRSDVYVETPAMRILRYIHQER